MTEQTINKQSKCAQCKKSYKPGLSIAGCPKCAPGVSISEEEFKMSVEMTKQFTKDQIEELLYKLRAHIVWTSFGECRSPGWEGPPPTAREAVDAIDSVLMCNGLTEAETSQTASVKGLTDKQIDNMTAHLYLNGKSVPADYRMCVVKTAIIDVSN